MSANYQLVTASSTSIITLAEAKAHLNIPTAETYDDTLITNLISVAQAKIEAETWRAIGSQTWKLWFDYADVNGYFNQFLSNSDAIIGQPYKILNITKTPLISVQSIQYYDVNNALQTLDSSKYQVDNVGDVARINIITLPVVYNKMNAFVINFTCGYTTIPEMLKHVAKMIVSSLYAYREDVTMAQFYEIPQSIINLIAPFKNTYFYPNNN
jgi:Phage gp6-like head-tail connector protein